MGVAVGPSAILTMGVVEGCVFKATNANETAPSAAAALRALPINVKMLLQEYFVDKFTQHVYLQELTTQCEFALTAYEVMIFALGSIRGAPRPYSMPTEFSQREVFRSVHSF